MHSLTHPHTIDFNIDDDAVLSCPNRLPNQIRTNCLNNDVVCLNIQLVFLLVDNLWKEKVCPILFSRLIHSTFDPRVGVCLEEKSWRIKMLNRLILILKDEIKLVLTG